MTKEEILEGNKLIATFLDNKIEKIKGSLDYILLNDGYSKHEHFKDTFWTKTIKYHYSWNWLIPLINKIYENDWYYKWKDTSGQFEKEVFINTKFIEVTWQQVIEFIKWYNEQRRDSK